jgi:3-hydroxypropionyl-coenzyme A dehydratase
MSMSQEKELIYTGKMITAEEAEGIGLVNRVIRSSTNYQEEQQQQKQEKQKANELAKILNKKLIDECISLAKEIADNSFMAVKTSKILINKAMDVDINTGLQLEVYGWSLCFAHEDRQKTMSAFLNKAKKKY